MLTLREALTRATGQLAVNPNLSPTALADAALLLMHTLGIDRAAMLAHPERAVSLDEMASYQRLLERRLGFEPMQYILGTQEFFGLTLRVTRAVLIPRPETELLVEAVLAEVAAGRTPADARIVDVGTGSGAIALALAHSLPRARVMAVDVSAAALEIAEENARRHGLAERIEFVQADLMTPVADTSFRRSAGLEGTEFAIVVSNPPYVADGEADALHPQVRDYEPHGALFAGRDGMDVYRRLIPEARGRLGVGGLLALEIGFGQSAAIAELLAGWDGVRFFEDLQGIARVVLARRR